MKKGCMFLLTIIMVFLLNSCFIGSRDSWKLDDDIKDELLSDYYDYINNEEYTGYTYQSRSWSCVNCNVGDGTIESWGTIVEDETRIDIYMNNDEYLMLQTDNYMSQYYLDGNLFLNIGETKVMVESSVEDLKLDERHLYVYEILKTILDPENIDIYVNKVSATEDFAGWITMTFDLDYKKLREDKIIDEETIVYLKLEFVANEENWDIKELYGMSFSIHHGITDEYLSLIAPDLTFIVSEYFPDDLDVYE